jgi:hypothetical protein
VGGGLDEFSDQWPAVLVGLGAEEDPNPVMDGRTFRRWLNRLSTREPSGAPLVGPLYFPGRWW